MSHLSPAQITALRALVAAEPTLATAILTGNDQAVAAWCNAEASPAFYGWRAKYTSDLIVAAIDAGITQVDGLSASKRDTLLWWAGRDHDATLAATRTAIDDLTGTQNTLKAAVLDGAKRKLTRAEKLLSTGTGSLAVPATTTLDGPITGEDASSLR